MSDDQPVGNIHVQLETTTNEYKAEDGTVLLTVSRTIPVVTTQNEAASNAINEYIRNNSVLGITTDDVLNWAKSDYKVRGKENWGEGYTMEIVYVPKRTDPLAISFLIQAATYMGGAHPSEFQAAVNFDTQTGRRLRLSDVISTDENTAKKEILAAILEQTKQDPYKDMLWEGYESNIADLLTEDSWYLTEDGLHIIGNEYIISPYAAGILNFVIPYNDAKFLEKEYRT